MRVKLEDVCERGTSSLMQKDIVDKNGKYPVYGASGRIGSMETYQQEHQTVAVVKDGAGIGRTMLLPEKSSVIGTMQYLIPKNCIESEYLYYVVKYMHLEKYFSGATIPHIYFRDYKTEEFNLHDKTEQREIVSTLKRIEAIISNRQEQLTKLDELIKARFVEMFENNTYPKVKVSTVCDFITKGTTPPNDLISEEYSSDKVPYLKVYNLSFNGELLFDTAPQYISENIHNGMLARSKVYPNDVLMNIVGPPLGKFSLVTDEFPEWNINQAIAIFRAKEKINPKYLLSALMQPEVLNPFLRQAVGIRQLNLSLSQCRDLEIFLPPLSLQNQFADFVAEVDKSKLLVGSAAAHKPFDIGFFSQKHCATPCKRGIISSKHVIFH